MLTADELLALKRIAALPAELPEQTPDEDDLAGDDRAPSAAAA
jgi:hypothetical protein